MSIELTNEMIAAIDASLKADAIKAAKGALAAGEHTVDFTVRIKGTVKKGEDDMAKPTVTTPWLTVMALVLHRAGFQRDTAMELIFNAMNDAQTIGKDDEAELMAVAGVAEARKKFDEEVLCRLPLMPRQGKVTSKLGVEVVG